MGSKRRSVISARKHAIHAGCEQVSNFLAARTIKLQSANMISTVLRSEMNISRRRRLNQNVNPRCRVNRERKRERERERVERKGRNGKTKWKKDSTRLRCRCRTTTMTFDHEYTRRVFHRPKGARKCAIDVHPDKWNAISRTFQVCRSIEIGNLRENNPRRMEIIEESVIKFSSHLWVLFFYFIYEAKRNLDFELAKVPARYTFERKFLLITEKNFYIFAFCTLSHINPVEQRNKWKFGKFLV